MKSRNLVLTILLTSWSALTCAITIQEVPQCAQDCLANSTDSQTRCPATDIACLCQDPGYVSALACCLATQCDSDEQATAIEFNQQECSNVNESAPNFVGCAPSNLASSLSLEPSTTSSPQTTLETATLTVFTISGSLVSEPANMTGSPVTVSFDGRPLLTGSCTEPYFAFITGDQGTATEFPQLGCAQDRLDCCPFPFGANGVLTRCPKDHSATAGGCCPRGFQMYSTGIGEHTPCYSMLTPTVVPETTLSGSVTLITDHVFARRYELGTSAEQGGLSTGALAGISVAAGVVFIGSIGALWFWRHRKMKQINNGTQKSTSFPIEDSTTPVEDSAIPIEESTIAMPLASQPQPRSPQELASPEQQRMSPRSTRMNFSLWPMGPRSSAPYDAQKAREGSLKGIPQELPGSTYMHEHHPAFSGANHNDLPSPASPPTPEKPTRSFTGGSHTGTSMVTQGSSTSAIRSGRRSTPIVSPLSSLRMPPRRRTWE